MQCSLLNQLPNCFRTWPFEGLRVIAVCTGRLAK
jgi:hypothetical protein